MGAGVTCSTERAGPHVVSVLVLLKLDTKVVMFGVLSIQEHTIFFSDVCTQCLAS